MADKLEWDNDDLAYVGDHAGTAYLGDSHWHYYMIGKANETKYYWFLRKYGSTIATSSFFDTVEAAKLDAERHYRESRQ